MSFVSSLAGFFCHSLGMGIAAFSVLADSEKTGSGLVKLIFSISLAALLLCLPLTRDWWYFLPASFCLLIRFFHGEKKNAFIWMLYFLQLGVLLWLTFKVFGGFFALSSSALLGVVTYAMVLGHWYLVTPRLSEKPLLRAFFLMWGILALKLGSSLWLFWERPELFYGWGSFDLMILTMRLLWGYLMLVGLGFYGHRLVKMRSIQSATGVLYVMTFFVFAGEILSRYLYRQFGVLL